MITFEEAKQIALNKIGSDCALFEDATIEKPYGWYFYYQSKAYFASGDWDDGLIGNNGFFVEREDGRVLEFGSGYGLERDFAAYEAGFKSHFHDLTIISVSDKKQTIRLLHKLDMIYVIPEYAHGAVWKIPQKFTKSQIRSLMSSFPRTFYAQDFYPKIEVFAEIDATGCCKYALREHPTE
ncbi:YrhB domain-containing protein [Phormidium tenue]|uniref:Immunity protein 35 domain-containing protein n=1 Tax=Phormidium tenue NIES-30 TaxID=549789 RepID=A0A1U7J3X7_9CYAN|nr:YrhB domain-containing protein [Phormidium tenue]MBD2233098.1 hypothetical protein [Phormidium tenue FACHB-1052]OKH47096.1 hypothetical protein NIES30_13985 [Phormidium tenue NIES-30]